MTNKGVLGIVGAILLVLIALFVIVMYYKKEWTYLSIGPFPIFWLKGGENLSRKASKEVTWQQ